MARIQQHKLVKVCVLLPEAHQLPILVQQRLTRGLLKVSPSLPVQSLDPILCPNVTTDQVQLTRVYINRHTCSITTTAMASLDGELSLATGFSTLNFSTLTTGQLTSIKDIIHYSNHIQHEVFCEVAENGSRLGTPYHIIRDDAHQFPHL